MSESPTLYEKYGGLAALRPIVHAFYERVCASKDLAPWFDGVDMAKLIDHQVKYLCKVVGGPDYYSGRALTAAHTGLAITPDAFLEVAGHLADALSDAGFEDDDVKTVVDLVSTLEDKVVGL